MKNSVQIRIGFSDEFKPLKIGSSKIFDFEAAIKIIRLTGLKNVFLKKIEPGITTTWDNL